MNLTLTKFSGAKKPQGKSYSISWTKLVSLFKEPKVFDSKKSMPLFSCTEFEDDYRNEENAGKVWAIVGDHDAGTMSPEDAAKILREHNIAGVVYTTASHTWDDPRFRIIVRLSEKVGAKEHKRLVRVLNGLLGDVLAKESELRYQAWFYGRVAGLEYECHVTEGDAFDDAECFIDVDEVQCGEEEDDDVDDKPRKKNGHDILTQVGPQAEPPTEEAGQRIRDMLEASGRSADCDYGAWRDTLFILHSTQHPDAKEIAREWSMTAPKAYNEEEFERVWESAKGDRHEFVALGTLHKEATDRGWVDPKALLTEDTQVYGDVNNGRRFAAKHRGEFKYVHAAGKWLRWAGQRWEWCDNNEVQEAAKLVALDALTEANLAKAEDGSEFNRSNYNHALAVYRNIHRIENMMKAASSEPGMSVSDQAKFDMDPWLLGVKNGVVNLRTGKLVEARPAMMMTKQCDANFNPNAECPRFLQFMNEIFEYNQEMIDFVQRMCGYAITGLATEQRFFFLLGSGANGKSVFSNIMDFVFGDYKMTADSILLARNSYGKQGEADRYKAALPGARLVLINEVGHDDVFDDQRVKELTSNDRITARYLHQEPFQFMPTHTIFLRGNHRPGVKDAGDAFWRRVVMIDFRRKFKEEERTQNLEHIIVDKEADGILNWIVEGCLAWQSGGLKIPKSVQRDVDKYRADSDLLGEWMAACCLIDPDVMDTVVALYSSYKSYMTETGIHASQRLKFTRDLEARGLRKHKKAIGDVIFGLKVRDEDWIAKPDDDEL